MSFWYLGKRQKATFFLGFYGNGISDYGNYGLESYVCYKHISQLSPTYYSTITLTLSLDGSIFLPTLPNNLHMSLNEAEYYILQSPYPAALIIVPVLHTSVKFDTQPKVSTLLSSPSQVSLCGPSITVGTAFSASFTFPQIIVILA